jgi:acyl dehydratase
MMVLKTKQQSYNKQKSTNKTAATLAVALRRNALKFIAQLTLAGALLMSGLGIAQAAITLSLEMNPDPVQAGERLRAELTVTNDGGTAVTGVVLQADFPTNINNLSQSFLTGGGTCSGGVCSSGDLVTWNLGTLAPGAGVTVTMPMVVSGATPDGTAITLASAVTGDAVSAVSSSHAVVVDSGSSLQLELDEDADPVLAGGEYVYTLTYGNRGAFSASGTTLSLPLPAGATLVSATGGGVQAGNAVEWSLGTLAAGEAGRQQVVVSVGAGLAAGTVLGVDAAQLSATVNFLSETARAMAVTRVGSEAPLVLGLEMNPDPVRPGQRLRGELTVTNPSGGTLFGVVLQARFPDGVNNLNQSFLTGGGTCSGSVCSSGDLVTWNLGTLPPGAGVTVALPMGVSNGLVDGQLMHLDAEVRADGGRQLLSAHTVAVDADGSLRLELDEIPDPTSAGGMVSYTLTFGNRGLSSVAGGELHFPLPANTLFIGATGGGTFIDGEVIWNLGTLINGEGGRRMVTLSVDPGQAAGTQLSVDAARITGTLNFLPETARAMAVTRLASGRPLELATTLAPNPAQPGQTLQTDLTVTNSSSSTLFGVLLQARFPDGVNNLSQSALTGGGVCSGGVCSSGDLVTWALGTLTAGATVTVSMPPVVSNGVVDGRLLVVDMAVTADSGDQTLATETVLIAPFNDDDGDGVASLFDNCTAVTNSDQLDTNGDGYGNLCDGDLNNDGATNTLDLNLYKLAHRSALGDANYDPDADFNGDGLINTLDLNIYKGLHRLPPGPSCCGTF